MSARPAAPSRILWKINRTCNFRCSYCFDSLEARTTPANRCSGFSRQGIEAVADAFEILPDNTHLCITGGEPFLHPDFNGLCRLLTRRHALTLNTNLSTHHAIDFADTVPPARTRGIRVSLHLLERERLGLVPDLVEKVNHFRSRGFPIYLTEVLSPPVLARLEPLADDFAARGITIWPILMRGYWQGRRYPTGYTRSEQLIIRRYHQRLKDVDDHLLFEGYRSSQRGLAFLDGQVSFKGLPCRAGTDCVFMGPDGEVQRCPDVRQPLGNLFQGTFRPMSRPMPCPARLCSCPWMGYMFAEGDPSIMGRRQIAFRIRQQVRDIVKRQQGPLADALRAGVSFLEHRCGWKLWD